MGLKMIRFGMAWVVVMLFATDVSRNAQAATNEPPSATFLKNHVPGVEGKDWNIITVELQPGAAQSWHFNPSEELLYVLEGLGQMAMEGRPPVTLKPGTVATLGSTPHHLLKNTSRTKTLKLLVVVLIDKGQQHPLMMSAQDGTTKPQAVPDSAKSSGIGLVF